MLRQIITPAERSFTLQLPKEMLGKTVEIIAFEINDLPNKPDQSDDKSLRLQRIENLTKDKLVDLSNFKFSRDDANNYDG